MASKLKKLSPEELAQKLATPGPMGPIGEKGEKGDRGDMGPMGPGGADGIRGDGGIQGVQGVQGSRGETGIPGISGQSGPQGLPGTDGQAPTLLVEKNVIKVENPDGSIEDLIDMQKIADPIRRSGAAQIGGGAGRVPDNNVMVKVITITSDHTVEARDQVILADASAGNIEVFLLPAARLKNRSFNIKRINSTGNFVCITPAPGEQIDEDTGGIRIILQYDCITIVSDGTEWWIV